ncbi:MAG TPA: ATP-binding cassette domain-containing protein [Aeromicrobium sp.]|nr:ATP-binding cassette domain-containing protein [Aeromicrobium sp.]
MTGLSPAHTQPPPDEGGEAPSAALDRLRVWANGTCRDLTGPSARLGRLGFVSGADGWHVFDEGLVGGMYVGGSSVRHLLFDRAGRYTLRIGGPEGHVVDIEVPEQPPVELAVPDWVSRTPAAPPDPAPGKPVLTVVKDVPEAAPAADQPVEPVMVETRTSPAPADRPVLIARRLAVRAHSGRVLISDIDVALGPKSLTAVIGPSGAGKSTLLHSLAGQIPPADGGVWWLGHHLHDEYLDLRTQIGFVPQEEIQHPQLGVRQSLTFSARLRLPDSTTRGALHQRVDDVIAQVGMEAEQRQRIGSQLSGGQKKRVSIATELLTAPPLLFLDEPTSGLDPGRDRTIMHQLRQLADDGRVVVVATHSVLGLDLCDTVVVMARGGRLAYAGPPEGLLEHFQCTDYPEMFDLLETPDGLPRTPASASAMSSSRRSMIASPTRSAGRQFVTLVRRNLALLFADRMHLTMLLAMPLVLAALSRIVQGEHGLGLWKDGQGVFHAMEANQRLTILIIAAALMGTAMSIRELVQERAIFRREYAVGLSPGAYFASKALVFGVVCFLQGVIVARLATWRLPEQDHRGILQHGWWEIAVPLGLFAAVMSFVGLWISAKARSTEQTTPALVGVVMVQIALCGALIPVAGRAVIEQLTMFAPGRWAFAATASSANLDRSPRFADDGLINFTSEQYWGNLAGLAILGILVLWGGYTAVRRSP